MTERLKPGPSPTLSTRDEFEMRMMREAGVTVRDCAAYFSVSMATAFKALARLRKRLGPEKLPNKRRARSYLTHPQLSSRE